MRVTTSLLYSSNIANLNTVQEQLVQTNRQISTGRRILDPSMDPVGAARAVELSISNASNTQYQSNNMAASNSLGLSDGVLENVTSLLKSARDAALTGAGGKSVVDTNRLSLARELRGHLNDLLGLANSTDGNGNFLYSGGQGSVRPFVQTAAGVVYQGDDMQRNMQVSPTRQVSSSDSGADIFMRVRSGNGTFHATLGAGNTGSAGISQGVVTNSALYAGDTYQVTIGAGGTTYGVTNVTTGTPVIPAGTAYTSGQAISFDGIQFAITGTPAAGDTFDIKPSANQSIFTTLENLIATLETPLATASAAVNAASIQAMQDGLNSLDMGMNSVLAARANTGSRMNELELLQGIGQQFGLQYQKTLSSIQDTDYNKAATDFAQQKLVLEAAQMSFTKISQMSLFNYL